MFSQFFFNSSQSSIQSTPTITFKIPQIIIDYEKDDLKTINVIREENTYMLSYERKMREMGAKSPEEPDFDIGVTKRCTTLPFVSEYRLMFISAMMEASTYNGGTHLNATSGLTKHMIEKREIVTELRQKWQSAVDDDREDDIEELQGELEEAESGLEVGERFFSLNERFHEAMYTHFNCQFAPHTSIMVAWIISVVEEDKASRDIIEKFFGINQDNWKDGYDEQLYYETLQKTCSESIDACGLDFTWATTDYCTELEQARVYNYNIAHPCSSYDAQIYRILAQLIMIDHIEGIDWILAQEPEGKRTLQDVDPTVIYGRLSLFSFASQLDEDNLTMIKALVKRKSKIVVNSQYSETSNIFVSTFCDPHLSDDQCLSILEYWQGFCSRNSKANKMHINMYEYWTLLNKSWSLRYTRSTRTQSLRFIVEKVLPPTTALTMLTSKEPNFLSLLLSTLVSQSSYAEISPSGNTSTRYGDFACVAYEQELLGVIYSILFPDLQSFARAFQLVSSPIALFTPIFMHQSKSAFDYIFFQLKFPPQLQFIPFLINCMLPASDWASCVDVQSILLQYQQHVWAESQVVKKKKAKKGVKKGAKRTFADAAAAAKEEELTTSTAPTIPQPDTDFFITADTLRSGDCQFFSLTNTNMIMTMNQHELNSAFQIQTLTNSNLSNKQNKKQLEYIETANKAVSDALGKDGSVFLEQSIANEMNVNAFDEPSNVEKVNNLSFDLFKKHILSPYKQEMISTAQQNGNSDDEMTISNQIDDLFYTCLSPDKHLEYTAKYDLLSLNTQVIDALIWFVDTNEKVLAEEYGGCSLSYAFVLYTLSCTLTLFIQDSTNAYQQYVKSPGKSADDPECPPTPSHQLIQLYLALISSVAVPQASPIYQTFQLVFSPSNPFPVAYQHFLLRVNSNEVRGFYNPWVQNLYACYANTRMVGELAVDLERLVQNSAAGKRVFQLDTPEKLKEYGLNTKLSWNLEGLTVEYNTTPLYQTVLTAIMTECLSQSYMNSFQQHYPLRMQFIQTLMRAQYSRGQQPSPICPHTYKFMGISGLQHLRFLFSTIKCVPLPILNVLFNLFPSLDITSSIATAVDVANVHSLWRFIASRRLPATPSNPSVPIDTTMSFLSLGSHPSWMLDTLDMVLNCDVQGQKAVPQFFSSLLDNTVKMSSDDVKPTNMDLYVATNNPIYGAFLTLSQYYTPIVATNELLSMNFWPQLMNSFSSLAAKVDKFLNLSHKRGEDGTNTTMFPEDFEFDPETQFTLLAVDPTWTQGIAELLTKYTSTPITKQMVDSMLFKLLKHQTHNFVTKHDSQQEQIGEEYSQDQVVGFNLNTIIDGSAKPLLTKKEQEEAAMFDLPTPSAHPSFTIGGSALDGKKSGGKNMMNFAMGGVQKPQPKAKTDKDNNKSNDENESTSKPVPTDTISTPVEKLSGEVDYLQPEHVVVDGETSQKSAMGTLITVGAFVGLVGAALYAGFNYFQKQQQSKDDENQ